MWSTIPAHEYTGYYVLINAHSGSVGESAVGKSSLVLRFVKGQFHEYQESTIGGKSHYIVVTCAFTALDRMMVHVT